MKIAILDLSFWPPEFMSGEPRFGEVIAQWARIGLPEAVLSICDIVEGAPFPEIETFDGFIVSGSDKGVYDETPWMADLRAFLLAAREAGKPLFGICFGHQIMADTFGGKAEKVGEPEVGVRSFELNGQPVRGHVWHQDQVTKVPPDARVIASSKYCPVAGLSYEFPALSVQFHPEYPADFITRFLRRSRGHVLAETAADKALAELEDSDVPLDLFSAELAAFFQPHHANAAN